MLVICNGMMRAGSTLQYNIVRNLIEKLGLGKAHGYYDNGIYKLSESRFMEWLNDEDYYHVIKMHDIHPKAFENKNNPKLKICYIYRDIRDVAVSIKNIWGNKGEKLYSSLDRAISIYYSLEKFPNVLFQKYEEVISNLPKSVIEISQFLNININSEIIEEIIKECSIEKMEKISKNPKFIFLQKLWNFTRPLTLIIPPKFKPFLRKITGFEGAIYDKKTHIHPYHISKYRGSIGVWRTSLSREEVGIISKRYKNWLIKNGYFGED